MSFGIAEGLTLLGAVGKFLNPQQQAPQKASLDRDEFMSMFQEAMSKYGQTGTSTVPVDDATAQDKLEMLFSFLDTNQDGAVSKGEFNELQSMITSGKLRV